MEMVCLFVLNLRYYSNYSLGVQEAFEYVNKVVTLSVHKLAHGFFPGTGALQEIGKGVGKSYKINMPFKSGLDDNMLFEAFSK